MENWNNLNRLLDENRKSVKRKEEEALQLIECVQKNEKDKIKELLKSGASVNCFADNSTPLNSCIENDNYDLASYLLNVRASISYRGSDDQDDSLWYALKNKKSFFVGLFVSKRCILTLDNETRLYPLIYSTIQTDLKSVEELLKHYRINVNEKDGGGNTALHHNVSKETPTQDDLEIGKLLIAAGADTNTRNLDGKTPEEAAVDFSSRAMLTSSKLEQSLEEKIDMVQDLEEKDPAISKTKSNKIKI